MIQNISRFFFRFFATALCFFFIVMAKGQAPEFAWVKQVGGTSTDNGGSVHLDPAGNVVITGGFSGTVDFDPGTGVYNLTSIGGRDIFVSKFNNSGGLLWAVQMGGAANESNSVFTIDADGNIILTGAFGTTIDVNPGIAVFNLVPAGNDDVYIVKLDPSGNFIWAGRAGGPDTDLSTSVVADGSGNIYVTGSFRETADFDPGTGTFNLTATALYDIYIFKLDAAGNFVWANRVGGFASDVGSAIAIDATNNVYITGHYSGTVDFDPGPGTFNMSPGNSTTPVYILKLNDAGSFVWAKQMWGTSGNDITIDPDGNIYSTGTFHGTADFDPGVATFNLTAAGAADVFISKLDPSGNLVWAKQFSGTNNEYGYSIRTDADGNVYTAGLFFGTVYFKTDACPFSLTSAGLSDVFISKLDPSGNFVFAVRMGGTGNDNTTSATIDPSGFIYTTGVFADVVDFDPGAATLDLTSAGGSDIFLQKLTTSGPIILNTTGFAPASGQTGTSVTLTGTNFSSTPSNNAVTFNGTSAVVTSSTTTSITVTVPSGATTGPIAVTVAGNTATSSCNFTVTIPVSISISTQPTDSETCDGEVATLSVAATGTTNITYQWQKFNASLSSFENVAAGSGYSGTTSTILSVDFSIVDLSGDYRCQIKGDLAADVYSNTVTATELPLPSAPATTGITADACGPQTHLLTATSGTAGEFRWYQNATANFPDVTETAGTFTTPELSASATYYVSLYDGACESDRAPATVTVNDSGPGTLDNAFNLPANGLGSITFIDDMEIQPDGKVISNGYEEGYTEYMLSRFLPDGAPDPAFNHWEDSFFNGRIDVLALQSDGKILAGGRFTTIDGDNYGRIARFNSDGTVDLTFNVAGSGFNGRVYSIEVQPGDKIIVAGNFTTYNGSSANRIIRLISDGTVDATFNPGTGANGLIGKIVIQSDDKVVIGGSFTTYNSTSIQAIARLNADGSQDVSFVPASVPTVSQIEIQNDNKLLISGGFTTVGGVTRNGIARLNLDGTLDTSFDPGTGVDDDIYAIYEEPSGKILVGGWFQNFNGISRNFLARLNPNGSLDNFFDPGIGPYSLVTNIKPYGANRVLVGGYIDQWNGKLHNGIGLINNECIRVPVAFDNSSCGNTVTLSACGGVDGQYRWYTNAVGGTAIAGENNSSLTINDFSSTATYYVTLKDAICESVRVPVVATLGSSLSAPLATGSSGCTGESQILSASGAVNGQYRWYKNASGGTAITGQTNAVFTTPPLSATTTYHVSINDGVCESARTEVIATITACATNTPPVINTTQTTTSIGEMVTIDLLALISDEDQNLDITSLQITQPSSGAIATISGGVLTINYAGTHFSGTDSFSVRICDDQDSCTEQIFTVEVSGNIIVYNAVSPNADGLNDILRLEYIELIEDTQHNKVTIFNRWGDVVFEINDYDNSMRVFKGLNKNGNALPTGAYLYKIEFASGRKTETGYLYLKQ